jgi:hypothetical protein
VQIADSPALAGVVAPVELDATPFFPQEALQCGPAALATVLGAAGVPALPADLVPEVFTPGLEGSLQPELLGAVRRRGLLPYEVSGDLKSLVAQVVAGSPVLILQNLGLESFPIWHYAVVVGLDPAANRIILRSGGEARLIMSARKFLRTWERADRWGFVVVRPGELPAAIEPAAYSRAVIGLESVGRFAEAARAWEAGLKITPGQPVYLFGLGNARYALDDLAGARAAWEHYVALRPEDPSGLNNLAVALGELGCRERGMSLAERALDNLPEADPARTEISRSLQTLRAMPPGRDAGNCQAPRP